MKKFFTLKNILLCVAAVLGLIAFFLMFAPAATVDSMISSYEELYRGTWLTFGYTAKNLGLGTAQIWKFSFMNFLTYLLVVVGIVFAVLAFWGKLGKISAIVSSTCFLIAGIFFFCVIHFCVFSFENAYATIIKEHMLLGAGAIISGIFSIIAALASCATLLVEKFAK